VELALESASERTAIPTFAQQNARPLRWLSLLASITMQTFCALVDVFSAKCKRKQFLPLS
jgi:hypothetical protein